jgi:hypothetical protein
MNCKAIFNPNNEALPFTALIGDICAKTHRGFRISVSEILLPLNTIYDGPLGLNNRRVDDFPCRSVEAFITGRQGSIIVTEIDLTLPVAPPKESSTFSLRCHVLRAWSLSDKPGSGWALRAPEQSDIPSSWHDFLSSIAQVSHVTGQLEISPVPDLISAIEDAPLRAFVQKRYRKIKEQLEYESWESAVVECGRALEAVLEYTFRSKVPDRAVPQKLSALIDMAVEHKLVARRVGDLSHSVRCLRNDSAHLKIGSDGECNQEEAEIAFSLLKLVLRDLPKSTRPPSAA